MSKGREGSVARAESLLFDRESLATVRRGVPYEALTPITTPALSRRFIALPSGVLLAHIGTELWRRNSAGSWTQITGTFSAPESGFAIRDVQMKGYTYITGQAGVKRTTSSASTSVVTDQHAPLAATGSTTGSSGFLADASACGYRFVLYVIATDGREIVTAPSQQLVVTNTVGGAATRNVALTVYIPTGLTTSHYWRAYRSAQVTPATAIPSDELQLCAEGRITSTNISNGFFTLTDSTTDSLRGATLYTSPSQEGIAQANDTPPHARDIALFAGCLFYANYTGKHRFPLNLLGTGTTALRFVADNVATTNGSPTVTSVGNAAQLRVGMKAKASAGIPSTARILSINVGSLEITLSVNATATGARDVEFQDVVRLNGVEYFAASATAAANREFLVSTGGTASQNIEATARALVLVVCQDASATIYGFYDSTFDGIPGVMRFQERAIAGSSFQVSSTATDAFSPTLPSTDDGSQVSVADRRASSLIPSKLQQPEAVPLAGGILCSGSKGESTIRRILALREALVVLGDTVGLITGTGPGNFAYREIDTTCKLIGPETAVVVADAVYCVSNQGVVRISTGGVQIASRDIEGDILRGTRLTDYATKAFGVSYETDRSYLLFVPTANGDTQPTFAWRYHVFTDDWSHAVTAASAGIVDPVSDELVLFDQSVALVRRERKSLDRTDYADDSLGVTITSSSGLTVNLASAANLVVGDKLVQSTTEIYIDAINSNALTMRSVGTWSNGAATAYRAIDPVLETLPWTGGDASIMKEFREIVLIFREAEFERLTVSFATNFEPNFSYSTVVYAANTNSSYSVQPSGSEVADEQPIRVPVPIELQYGHWLRVRLTFQIARERMVFAGWNVDASLCSRDFQGAVA